MRSTYHISIGLLPCLAFVATVPTASAQRAVLRGGGVDSGEDVGSALAGIGDLSGDGFDDFIVGVPRDDSVYSTNGRVEVISGRDGSVIHRVYGDGGLRELGGSVAAVGDWNGDGIGDFAATTRTPPQAIVYSGVDASVLLVLPLSDWASSLSNVGDVDGDGRADLGVGIPDTSITQPEKGKAFVYAGGTGSLLFELEGSLVGDAFGSGMSAAGDVNGDGFGDFLVGAPGTSISSPQLGYAVLLAGPAGAELERWSGDHPGSRLGSSVGVCGDLDADGQDDLLIAAPQNGSSGARVGAAYVYSSATRSRIRTFEGGMDNEQFGVSLHDAGDIDGDGVTDIAIGSPRRTTTIVRAGALLVYSGATSELIYTVSGNRANALLGTAAAFVGDANGDGMVDSVVGAPGEGANDQGAWIVHSLDLVNGGALCVGDPNSTGTPGVLTTSSVSGFQAAANDLFLTASSLPKSAAGYFLVSPDFGILLAAGTSSGRLCIRSTSIGRFASDVLFSGSGGTVTYQPDLTRIPKSSLFGVTFVPALPGSTFHFQLWHRDQLPGGVLTSNFSGAVTVTFS